MATLLPPTIDGPVYTFSTQARVSGASKGATVQAFQNGNPVGTTGIADSTGIAFVGLAANSLLVGAALTATQRQGGDSSQPGPGTIVLGVPASLSPPIFLSRIHTCMDAVLLGGIQVGAVVEVTAGGVKLGDMVADATEISVGLVRLRPLAPGTVVEARQTLTQAGQTLSSSRTPSFPTEQTPVLERTLPAPQILGPIVACDRSVLVTGIFDGMQMRLDTSDGGGGIYPFSGNAINASTKSLKEGVKVKATQFSQNCTFDSLASNEVIVGKATELPSPTILGPVCSGLAQVAITNLVVGAELNVYAGRDSTMVLVGTASVASATQTFGLPDVLPSVAGAPPAYLLAIQSRCGIRNPVSVTTGFDQRAGTPPAPSLDVLFECARIVQVFCADRAEGCALQIFSDDPTTPILSSRVIVRGSRTVVRLFRQLRAGENITAVLTGCGAGPEARQTRPVGTIQLPTPNVLEPLRSWQRTVFVGGTVVGAQVYLFINGKFAGHAEATEGPGSSIRFPVDHLALEDKVTAQQTLCTKFSALSRVASVTLGQMVVSTFPSPIVRAATPQTVVVVVKDLEDKHDVAGSVQLPGITHPTNTAMSWVFAPSQAGPPATVTAPDYAKVTVVWNLVDPPPVAPPTPPASLTLELINQVTNAVLKKAEWDVSHIVSFGGGPTVVDTKSGNPASSILPKPVGTEELFFIGCTGTFEYNGSSASTHAMLAPLPMFADKATIGWQGKPARALFALRVANGSDANGQPLSVFYIHFLELKLI